MKRAVLYRPFRRGLIKKHPLKPGTLVFWLDSKSPYWVIEFQIHNGIGGSYWLTDAKGNSACASRDELAFTPPDTVESSKEE